MPTTEPQQKPTDIFIFCIALDFITFSMSDDKGRWPCHQVEVGCTTTAGTHIKASS